MRREDSAMAVLEANVVPFALPNRIECECERVNCLLRNSSKICNIALGLYGLFCNFKWAQHKQLLRELGSHRLGASAAPRSAILSAAEMRTGSCDRRACAVRPCCAEMRSPHGWAAAYMNARHAIGQIAPQAAHFGGLDDSRAPKPRVEHVRPLAHFRQHVNRKDGPCTSLNRLDGELARELLLSVAARPTTPQLVPVGDF